MEDNSYLGLISVREEFFYPDSALMTLPRSVRIAMPLNAKPGIQLILQTDDAQNVRLYSFASVNCCASPLIKCIRPTSG